MNKVRQQSLLVQSSKNIIMTQKIVVYRDKRGFYKALNVS